MMKWRLFLHWSTTSCVSIRDQLIGGQMISMDLAARPVRQPNYNLFFSRDGIHSNVLQILKKACFLKMPCCWVFKSTATVQWTVAQAAFQWAAAIATGRANKQGACHYQKRMIKSYARTFFRNSFFCRLKFHNILCRDWNTRISVTSVMPISDYHPTSPCYRTWVQNGGLHNVQTVP